MDTLSCQRIFALLGRKNCFVPLVLVAFFLPRVVVQAQGSAELKVTVEPANPLIEHRDGRQLLNFDFAVSNRGKSKLRLAEIEVSVFDSAGHLVLRKTVNSNGFAPGIDTVAQPLLAPGETEDIFNPFYSFGDELPLHHMEFAFRYLREDNEKEHGENRHRLPMDFDLEVRTSVLPVDYETKTKLILPLTGRVLIWDGHDFYSHHRRVPLDAASVQKMGIHANSNRYGADLVIVDEQGLMYQHDPYGKKNWYAYGAPIYAPAEGQVVATADNIPDNEFIGKQIHMPELPAGSDPDLGNYVLIDHLNGEFSVLPHMMPGSVLVKAGDAVHQGEKIGRVGFSGDAIFPHVHYSLLFGPDIYRFEGLPAYFTRFRRLLRDRFVDVQRGTIDSGDILENSAEPYVTQSTLGPCGSGPSKTSSQMVPLTQCQATRNPPVAAHHRSGNFDGQ